MKKLWIMILIACATVSFCCADTVYQMIDYAPSATAADVDTSGGAVLVSSGAVANVLQYRSADFIYNEGSTVVDTGSVTPNGSNNAYHFSTFSTYSPMGILIYPQANLNAGDTWELSFAVKKGVYDQQSDIVVAIGNGTGNQFDIFTLPKANITNEWVTYDVSVTYPEGTLPSQVGAGGWTIYLYMANPTADANTDVYVSIIPEPTTICLLGVGALSLLRRKK